MVIPKKPQRDHLFLSRYQRHNLWRKTVPPRSFFRQTTISHTTHPTMSLPRLARPRALKSPLHTRPRPNPSPTLCLYTLRNASSTTPTNTNTNNEPTLRPLVLEQPDKFRPPSHGARKPRKPRHFGPSLSEEEIKEQATKRYPHSMPPEGTVMRKFLESKGIHVWISMVCFFSFEVLVGWGRGEVGFD